MFLECPFILFWLVRNKLPTLAVCVIGSLCTHIFFVIVLVRVALRTCCCFYCMHSTGAAANCLTWLHQNIKDGIVIKCMFFFEVCVLFGKILKTVFFISFRYVRFPFSNIIQHVFYFQTLCPVTKHSYVYFLSSLGHLYLLHIRFAVPEVWLGYSAVNCPEKADNKLVFWRLKFSPKMHVHKLRSQQKKCIGMGTRKYFNTSINRFLVKC